MVVVGLKGSPRALIVVNAEWYFWSHRLAIAKALKQAGYDVVVAAAEERGYGERISAAGIRFIPLALRRRSTGLRQELNSIRALYRLYRNERPAIVHHVAIKPVLYGSIAARFARVPAVLNAGTLVSATCSSVIRLFRECAELWRPWRTEWLCEGATHTSSFRIRKTWTGS